MQLRSRSFSANQILQDPFAFKRRQLHRNAHPKKSNPLTTVLVAGSFGQAQKHQA
jgi:hypothetical protein